MSTHPRFVVAGCLCVLALCLLSPASAAAACSALPSWFTGNPPNLPTAAPQNPCQFEQWAWQSLLALLTTGPGQPVARYFTWDLPKPDMQNLYCTVACGSRTPVAVKNPCGGPVTEEVVNGSTQPGFPPPGHSGRLVDQTGQLIYFTSHISPSWVDYVTGASLFNPAVFAGAPPGQAWPPGVFETKAAWRFASGLSRQEAGRYLTAKVCVVPEEVNGMHPAPFEAEMGLIGFHVTGAVAGHPELLWATFEHVDNAPDCDQTPIVGPWTLYDSVANCRAHPSLCNQPSADDKTPTNVCRVNPFGGAAVDVAVEIAQLNRDVHSRLPRTSPLQFYNLVGTVWSADPLPCTLSNGTCVPIPIPTFNLQNPAGSPLLANTTLETFKQDVSCFGCHNSQFPAELAPNTAPPSAPQMLDPVTAMDKSLFASHVVLFPFFFKPLPCSAVCPAPGTNGARGGDPDRR